MTNPLTVNYRQNNVHPADRLLELREQIKGLQDAEPGKAGSSFW